MREFVSEELQAGQLRELRLSVEIPPRQVVMVCSSAVPLSSAAAAFTDMAYTSRKNTPDSYRKGLLGIFSESACI
ncbi:MAG: hypothetical protein ACOX17_03300 [Christensenellales bacterium]|jgi:hypothetical protein